MDSESSSQVQSTAPLPIPRLTQIANDACDSAFQSATSYEHANTSSWNTSIINTVLQRLISESSASGQQPLYKFAVTSTIIQQNTTPSKSVDGNSPQDENVVERRGMHSASGAYWNNEKDGMWTYKYEKAELKGFDVVLSILWISVI